jgi:hypothetical protein
MARLSRPISSVKAWLHPRRYRLDDDRYVEELTNTLLRYHEGKRSVLAGYEDLGDRTIGVFPDQIGKWEPRGTDNSLPDETERERIISAIRDAYASRGIVVADTAELVTSESGVAILEEWNRSRASSKGRGRQ